MEERPEGNHEFETPTIFSVLNNYFLLFFALTCVLASLFTQQLFYLIGQLRLGICAAPIVGIILPVWLITRRFPTGVKPQLRIKPPRPSTTAYVIVATLTTVVIVDFIYFLSQKFMPIPTDYIEGLRELKPEGMGAVAVTFIGLCVIVPIGEEIVFRGIIQRVFSRNMHAVFAVILAGVFFGVIHLTPQLLLSMVFFGIYLGYLFFVTSNLTYSMLAHGLLNATAFVQLVFSTEEQLSSMPDYVRNPFVVGGSIVVFLLVMFKMRRGDSE